MTSTASQQTQVPAPNNTASSATSYASAASATKKPASTTPLIVAGTTGTAAATGASHPPVVVGSTAQAGQNGKPPTGPSLNGRPPITPAVPTVSASAVPAVVHGSSNLNGASVDHSRKSSVTISANAPGGYIPNGGPVGVSKAGIQFGFDSPSGIHSTPQPGGSAPIPIPGGHPRIPSPAHSPSPIPQPSASGGRPPSGMQGSAQMTFGSFQGDGDRHMRQPSIPQNPLAQQTGPHGRKDSTHSIHSDMGNHGGPLPVRGGFQGQGGRGRTNYNNPQFNSPMGYPPSRPYSGGPNQGRGGIPNYSAGRGAMGYNQSPGRSPAMQPSMPHTGTPNLPPAMPMPGANAPYYAQIPPPYVNAPFFFPEQPNNFKYGKKKGNRQDGDVLPRNRRRSDSSQKRSSNNNNNHNYGQRYPRLSKRTEPMMEPMMEPDPDRGGPHPPALRDGLPPHDITPLRPFPSFPIVGPIDLSPASGNYEKLLTDRKQNYPGFPPPQPYDHMGRPVSMGYPSYPQMHQLGGMMNNPPPPSPSPGFSQQAYGAGAQFSQGPPPAPAMSRNSSQVSAERPASTTGQNQAPVIAQGTPQPPPTQAKAPPIQSSNTFILPKKSAAITIKNSQGETVDLTHIKVPASPAPSIQQSKTPPVITSTPTPPPKSLTPSHGRSESTATAKTAEQLRNEFKEQVRKTAEAPADVRPSDEDNGKALAEKTAAEAKAREEEEAKVKEEQRLQKEKADEEARAAEEAKTKAEAAAAEAEASNAKTETETTVVSAAAGAAVAASAEKDADKAAGPDDMDDDELERIIREMEEEDARREKEQAELSAKKKAEEQEAKKRADAERLASAAENDRKLREQEREMERLEEERENQRRENEAKAAAGGKVKSVSDLLSEKISDLTPSEKDSAPPSPSIVADKLSNLSIGGKDSSPLAPAGESSGSASAKSGPAEKPRAKPAALNLAPLNTKPVEPPQPSAALQSLKSARFLSVIDSSIYPAGILSPNPALNAAVARKGKTFKYDAQFLLQFQKVFTEQPSMEFGQQVKALIGDTDGNRSASSARAPGTGSGRQNSRTGASGFPVMGSFGAAPPQKMLPPGTTSAERFAISQGSLPRPNSMNAMNFGRGGGPFPGGSQMARTPSSSNMGNIPGSPRQQSRTVNRGGSRRADFKADAQASKTPLMAGVEVKPITISASGWKPTSVGNKAQGPAAAAAQSGHLDPEMVQRKVKAALNKMTPEKFDKISDQILLIAGQSRDEQDGRTLRQVIQLTFEKATDESHWASMYAKFCKRMLDMMSPEIRDVTIKDKAGNIVNGGALFRKYLLNRCQEEFERGWKVDLPEPKEGEDKKSMEAALLSDEYYIAAAAKRRGLGLVQFIGELYKLGMLTERIMHECVRKLLEFQGIPDEAEIESLCKLLRTIGANLDSTEKGRPMMDVYFQRIQTIIDLPDLPSRLKFMLMDVVDLRKAQWASKEANKGPKTLEEVRAEAEAAAAQKAAESARNSQRGPAGGRPQMGRGDARNFSTYSQPAPNQIGMDDLRRLKGTAGRTASQNVTLGPTSMFSSRSNSGRRLGPGGSLSRAGEDSGASSRTGTPPTRERDSVAHMNAFGILATADTGEHPASPPSTSASPSLAKVVPDHVTAASTEKKDD